MKANNIVEFIYENVSENHAYQVMKATSPWGNSLCEIVEDGNLHVMVHYPKVTRDEIREFGKEYDFYYFERDNKAAVLLDSCRVEMIINPSYYHDDRFLKLLDKDVVILHSYLIDSNIDKVVAFNRVEIRGRQLEYLKKCLMLNSNVTREQYDDWITNVLYARDFDENIKRSIHVSKLRRQENIENINF